jgi:hypothetical protein
MRGIAQDKQMLDIRGVFKDIEQALETVQKRIKHFTSFYF